MRRQEQFKKQKEERENFYKNFNEDDEEYQERLRQESLESHVLRRDDETDEEYRQRRAWVRSQIMSQARIMYAHLLIKRLNYKWWHEYTLLEKIWTVFLIGVIGPIVIYLTIKTALTCGSGTYSSFYGKYS